MSYGLIIEIAVPGFDARQLPVPMAQTHPIVHSWRIRWIEDGEETDQVCQLADLRGMACIAEMAELPVAWRYYVTGVQS